MLISSNSQINEHYRTSQVKRGLILIDPFLLNIVLKGITILLFLIYYTYLNHVTENYQYENCIIIALIS